MSSLRFSLEQALSRRFRLGNLAKVCTLAVFVSGTVAVLFLFDPQASRWFPPCPFHLATRYYCPGCGSTRAMHCLLHGRVAHAITMNPLMVISIPVLGLMFLNPSWIYKRWVPWFAFGTLVAYGIARNIPYWPFILLAPQ